MAADLQYTADAITRAAGWKKAEPDSEGIFRFSLKDGLDFELLTPENRTGILRADLGTIPGDEMSRHDEIDRLAALAAGALKKRRSVFCICEGRLRLFRHFRLSDVDEQFIGMEVRDFLNDLSWWKTQLRRGSSNAQAPSNAFSFNIGGWFTGGDL